MWERDTMSDWICIAEPELVLIRVGAFQCPHCHRAVIAFSDDDIEKQAIIKNYSFCPYCGEMVDYGKTKRGVNIPSP